MYDTEFASGNTRTASRTKGGIDAGNAPLHGHSTRRARLFAKATAEASRRTYRLGSGSLVGVAAKNGGGDHGGDLDQLFGASGGTFSAPDTKLFTDNGNAHAEGNGMRLAHSGAIAKAKTAVKAGRAAVIECGCGTAGGNSHIIRAPCAASLGAVTANTRRHLDRLFRRNTEDVGNGLRHLVSAHGTETCAHARLFGKSCCIARTARKAAGTAVGTGKGF